MIWLVAAVLAWVIVGEIVSLWTWPRWIGVPQWVVVLAWPMIFWT